MAQVDKEEIYEIIDSAGNINTETEKLIMQLTQYDERAGGIANARDAARASGNHRAFEDLDNQLLETLELIANYERQVIQEINKDINPNMFQDASKIEYMLKENADKILENEILDIRLNNTEKGYEAKYGTYIDQHKNLIKEKDQLQAQLNELEKNPGSNERNIWRKKQEIEDKIKEIEEMQKRLDKINEIAGMTPKGTKKYLVEDMIEKNTRIIQNNLKNMSVKGITPNNFSSATQIIKGIYENQKGGADLFPMEGNYRGFEEQMTPQEFNYLSQEYQRLTGKSLSMSKSEPGFMYKLLHRGDIEDMIKARYPHLAAKDMSKELKGIMSSHSDDIAMLLKSGITPEMMRNMYRNIESDVRYQGSKNRAEWLKGIIVPQQQKDNTIEPQLKDTQTKDNMESRQETIEPGKTVSDTIELTDKTKQTQLDDFNDPINVLNGIEKLGLEQKVVDKLRNSSIYSIGDLIDVLNQNGIELNITQKEKKSSKKTLTPEDAAKIVEEAVSEASKNKKHKIVAGKPRIEPEVIDFEDLPDDPNYKKSEKNTKYTPKHKKVAGKTRIEPEVIDFENLPDDPNYKEPEDKPTKKKSKHTIDKKGIDISAIDNNKMENLFRGANINTVEEAVAKLENGEDIGDISSKALKTLRKICNDNKIENNVKWEQKITTAQRVSSEKRQAKRTNVSTDESPAVSKKIVKSIRKVKEEDSVLEDNIEVEINGDDISIGTVIKAGGRQKTIKVDDREDR